MAAKFKACSVEGCNKKHDAKGYCASHYSRLRRHGDPLGGITYNGEPDRFIAEVLTSDTDECVSWPYAKTKRGYPIMGDRRMVCRIICEEKIGPAPSPDHEAAHNCGNGHLSCVTWKHLRWATHKENCEDKAIHGTNTLGTRNAASKLDPEKVKQIRLLRGRMSLCAIGRKFGVSDGAIRKIFRRQTWAHV